MTLIEAYDLIAHAEQVRERIARALASLEGRSGLKRERTWLAAASELLEQTLSPTRPHLERAAALPELAEVREERARTLQNEWVDLLEKLHAGITFHAGSRAPLLETLFAKVKLPALRRASRETVDEQGASFEKRLATGYVKRMLSQESFAFALPVIEEVRAAFSRWQATATVAEPPEGAAETAGILTAAAKKLELPLRQARLLAEAALAPVAGAWEESGIAAKPRRRPQHPAAQLEPAGKQEQALPAPVPAEEKRPRRRVQG